jgi:hypothetical protein
MILGGGGGGLPRPRPAALTANGRPEDAHQKTNNKNPTSILLSTSFFPVSPFLKQFHLFSCPFSYCYPQMSLNFEIRFMNRSLNHNCSCPNVFSWIHILKTFRQSPLSSPYFRLSFSKLMKLMHASAIGTQ